MISAPGKPSPQLKKNHRSRKIRKKTLRKVQKKPLLWKKMCAWMPRMERRKSPGAAPPSRVQNIIKPIRRMAKRKKKMLRQWAKMQSLRRRKRAAYRLMMSSRAASSGAQGWALRRWRRKEWILPLVLPITRCIRSKKKTPAWSRRTRAKKRWRGCTDSSKAGKRPERNPQELRKRSLRKRNPAV